MKKYSFFTNFRYKRRYYHKRAFFSKSTKRYLLGIIMLSFMIVITESFLTNQRKHTYYNMDSNKTAEFREMKLSEV